MFKIYKYLLAPALIIANVAPVFAYQTYEDMDSTEWQNIPSHELDNLRGGFTANIGGVGVNLTWLVQVDVNDQQVLSHDIANDFNGKMVSINSAGDVAVSDFQSLALALQNSSDNVHIQANQIVDLQLDNISSFQSRALTAQITDSIIYSISN